MLHIGEIMAQDIHGRVEFINTDIHNLAHDGGKEVGYGAGVRSAGFITRSDAMRNRVEHGGYLASIPQDATAARLEQIVKFLSDVPLLMHHSLSFLPYPGHRCSQPGKFHLYGKSLHC